MKNSIEILDFDNIKLAILAFSIDLINENQLINWADSRIIQNDFPNQDIIEISLLTRLQEEAKINLIQKILSSISSVEIEEYELITLKTINMLLIKNEIKWIVAQKCVVKLLQYRMERLNLFTGNLDDFSIAILMDFEERKDKLSYHLKMPKELINYLDYRINHPGAGT